MILLTENQRQTLRELSDVREDNTYQSVNAPLEFYLRGLREQYPECFHIYPSTLKSRVFFDAPASASLPHARSVRPRSESPYLKATK